MLLLPFFLYYGMGQAASRAAQRLGHRIEQAAVKERTQAEQAAQQRSKASPAFSDPHALHGGFTRGEGNVTSAADQRQQQAIAQRPGATGEYQEMRQDLIQFINDMGPLKRKDQMEEKKQRKTRLPKSLREQLDEQEAVSKRPVSQRKKVSMPLAEKVEGYETIRSTSFSSKEEVIDPKDFGGTGDVLDIFELLHFKRKKGSTDEAVDAFYRKHVSSERESKWDHEDQERHKTMLHNVLNSIELPIVMKDTDNSMVGAWPSRVEELKEIKLVELPPSQVKLVLHDLYDTSEKEVIVDVKEAKA